MQLDWSFGRDEHEIAQSLAKYRNDYLSASEGDRRAARDWIGAVNNLEAQGAALTALPGPTVVLSAWESSIKHEHEHKQVVVPVRVLAKAIEAWERGDDYLPDLDDLIGR